MSYSSYLCISPSFELHFLLCSTPKLRCPNKFWWIFTRKVWHQQSFTFIIIMCKLIELASYIWTDVEPYKEWLIKFMKFFTFGSFTIKWAGYAKTFGVTLLAYIDICYRGDSRFRFWHSSQDAGCVQLHISKNFLIPIFWVCAGTAGIPWPPNMGGAGWKATKQILSEAFGTQCHQLSHLIVLDYCTWIVML